MNASSLHPSLLEACRTIVISAAVKATRRVTSSAIAVAPSGLVLRLNEFGDDVGAANEGQINGAPVGDR